MTTTTPESHQPGPLTTVENVYPANPDPSPLQIRLEAINFSTSLAIARLREGHDSSPADVVAGAEAFTSYITDGTSSK